MTEKEIEREVKRRLAIIRHAQEVTGNVAMTCRYYGISRQTFYKWNRRYEELGEDGLGTALKRPVSPNATKTDVVGKIIYLRQNYHFGPHKISMYLKRYHDIDVSHSGVWRILKRLGMSRLPASQRYKRHDKTLEALREAAPWPPGPDRCEVHRSRRGPRARSTTSSPPSTTAPGSGCSGSIRRATKDRHPVPRLRAREAALRGPGHSDRQWGRIPVLIPLARARPGHRPRLHQAAHPVSTARWRDPTGSTTRSSTGCSTASSSTTPGLQREAPGVGELLQLDRPHGGLGGQTPYERLRQKTQTPCKRSSSVAQLARRPMYWTEAQVRAGFGLRTGLPMLAKVRSVVRNERVATLESNS